MNENNNKLTQSIENLKYVINFKSIVIQRVRS